MTQYFATVARGLEEVAAQELEMLGAQDIQTEFTGVHFSGDLALLYRANLWAKTIFRILVPIRKFPCRDADQLYREVQKIDWSQYFSSFQTFAVKSTGKNRNLNHTHFTALQVKNAIVDQQRNKRGSRSNIDPKNPDILINAHIHHNQCSLSLDSSGESLHRRGYRPAMGAAPLKETLAAALLEMSDWNPSVPFLDPLCGAGTLPLEAGLRALNIAPGLFRQRFAFENWKDFDQSLWQQIWEDAEQKCLNTLPAPIQGCDRNSDILSHARTNARICGLENHITLTHTELSQLEAPTDHGVIICNPPYGKRLGNAKELGELYKQLGDIFKQRFKGWTAYILTGDRSLAKQVGLRSSRRIPVYNGALDCTLFRYELY